ncbi:MAG: type I pullulanase [Saprospiraceae bacterium]
MKIKSIYFLFLIFTFISCKNDNTPVKLRYEKIEDYPVYDGDDLGFLFSPDQTIFKFWSPNAQDGRVFIYEKDDESAIISSHKMKLDQNGVWSVTVKKNLDGKYYAFQVKRNNDWKNESPDPYSVACGRNGYRSQVLDFSKTNPSGWENDQRPPLAQPNDIIIYELHVRDLSIAQNSGIQQKGKYLGLAELGTLSPEGLSTGIDHIKELGVTHVHLLPVFDFRSLDEKKPEAERGYNWGYDPHLYNVPEGSYATDAIDGATRIREFKTMVKAFHDAGIRVVMDVVYNHTGSKNRNPFDRLVPRYYFRYDQEGNKSNASACGNETASERPMVRNFILQSVKYWAEEYHIDGFRFDLMGIHDIETMNLVSKTLNKIDPSIFVYGEGWNAGESPLSEKDRAIKVNANQLDQVAVFSDDIRDALKGHVFTADAKAFISGEKDLEESIKFGIVGATQHPQLDYSKVNYSKAPWANQPAQCINYVSCHDNNTLYDRLNISCPKATEEEKIKMARLALGIVLTSQGVPFLHAGSEFLRTKNGVENSYESPDSINQIDWSRKNQYLSTVQFVQSLIKMRKGHPAFKMTNQKDIAANLKFLSSKNNLITYQIDGAAVGDSWKKIVVVLNGNSNHQSVQIPKGNWRCIVKDGKVEEINSKKFSGGKLQINGIDMIILAQE